MRQNRVPRVGRAGLTATVWLVLAAVPLHAQTPPADDPPDAADAADAAAPAPADEVTGIPTEVVVRVRARGAMFVTTDMGAKVVVSDADTGEILASGVTTGTVGGAPDMRAGFRTTLRMSEPRRLRATASGPLSYPHAAVEVSSTQWVLPGHHLRGEGWVLEMPGFVVDLEEAPERVVLAADGPDTVRVQARVVMMCGCPTMPGGRWDADGYEIRAVLHRDGRLLGEYPLTYAGNPSTYGAEIPMRRPGAYELLVYAYDPVTGNTGLARRTVEVVEGG